MSALPGKPLTLRLGPGLEFELADVSTLDAFFATVSYRLEPDGWGTRFPLTLDHLNAGRLGPGSAPAAVTELETIGRELRELPARKAVWDFQDTRPRDDAALPVNRAAANLHDYFVAADGRTPLVERLRAAAQAAAERRATVVMPTKYAGQELKKALTLLAFGLGLGTVALLWFPHWFLTSHGGKDGPLIWAMGYLMAGFGAWLTLEARSPGLAAWRRRHPWVAGIAASVVSLGVVILSWSSGER